eukprot:scaffold34947_cov62-Phaeocystis_antarctica.AAC.2
MLSSARSLAASLNFLAEGEPVNTVVNVMLPGSNKQIGQKRSSRRRRSREEEAAAGYAAPIPRGLGRAFLYLSIYRRCNCSVVDESRSSLAGLVLAQNTPRATLSPPSAGTPRLRPCQGRHCAGPVNEDSPSYCAQSNGCRSGTLAAQG